MSTPLSVLIVEDSEDDMALIVRALQRGGYSLAYERVETAAAMSGALDRQPWDIVIADHNMPRFSAPAALTLLKDRGFNLPFIIVSGAIGEDIAVAAMKAGAHDYIMKNNLARLAPAVERELREAADRRKRRQAEEALGESEERFHTMADTAPVLIWMAGTDKFCHYFNKRWLDFTGRTIEQEKGYGWIEGVHSHDFQHCFDSYVAAFESRRDFTMEYRLRRADGEYRWILETGAPRYTPDGSFVGFIGSCVDITERKLAEAALESHVRQQAAVADLGLRALGGAQPAALMDEAAVRLAAILAVEYCQILELDPAAGVLLLRAGVGWKPGQIDTTIGTQMRSQAGYTLLSGEPVIVENLLTETRFKSPFLREHGVISGVSVVIHGRARPFGVLSVHTTRQRKFSSDDAHFLQSIAHVLATAIERKQTEEALQESQSRLSGIIGSAMDAIVTIDAEQRISLFNTAAEQMFRCSAAQAIGQPLDRLLPERFRDLHHKYIQAFGQSTRTRRSMRSLGVVYGLRANGEEFPIEASISQTEAAGRRYFTVIMRDVTERQRYARALESITAMAASLRDTPTRAAMASIVVEHVLALVQGDRAALAWRSPPSDEMLVEIARGDWAHLAGVRLPAEVWSGELDLVAGQPQPGAVVPARHTPAAIEPPGIGPAPAFVPLIVEHETLGLLWVGRHTPISDVELQLLATFGEVAANALCRATLHEQADLRLRRLHAARAIGLATTASLDLRLTLEVLLDQATGQLGVDAADVLIYNSRAQTLEYVCGRGLRVVPAHRPRAFAGESLAGRAAIERRILGIADLRSSREAHVQAQLAAAEGFVAYYGVPLLARGQVVGVLELLHRAPLAPNPEWLDFLETIAVAAAIAIDNAQMFEQLQHGSDERLLTRQTAVQS